MVIIIVIIIISIIYIINNRRLYIHRTVLVFFLRSNKFYRAWIGYPNFKIKNIKQKKTVYSECHDDNARHFFL
jgi:hypothetical protein